MLFLDQFVSAGKIPGVQNWDWCCLCVLCNIVLDVFKETQGHSSHKNKFEELCECSHFCLSVVLVLHKCIASLYLFFTKHCTVFSSPLISRKLLAFVVR